MGLLGGIIATGIATAARNSTIKAVGKAAVEVIDAKTQNIKEKNNEAVMKNGVLHIKPTRSSDGYIGENVLDVERELLGVGFNNISLKAVKKLGKHSVHKYGQINSISINGNDEFMGVRRVPATSYIIIEYLDFKDNVDKEVYANIKLVEDVKNNKVHNIKKEKEIDNSVVTVFKKYCPNCGEAIISERAKFCVSCGEKL